MLRVPAQIGPWLLDRLGSDFAWHVASDVSANDALRFHVRNHQTQRASASTRRILLIGESAAGSWGYFGKLNLAHFLELELGGPDARDVEVVDLSCVNANWRDNCLPLLTAGMTLDPDAVVIFCGNNEARWMLPPILQEDEPRHPDWFNLRWSYLKGDVCDTLHCAREAYLAAIERSIYDTVATCRAFGKPVLFVIPPYNCSDWVPPEQFPVLLREAERVQWANFVSRSQEALAGGDLAAAERFAHEAVTLDEGESQLALYLRGLARHKAGVAGAQHDLHSSAYAGLGLFLQAVPSLPFQVATKMAQILDSLQVPYIDLPTAFAQAGESPERPLFLDYCHLGHGGLQIAAAQIAGALQVQMPEQASIYDTAVLDALGSDTGRIECAVAFLCAALHGYQNGQPLLTIKSWLARAHQHSEAIKPLFRFLQRTSCTYFREWLTLEELRAAGVSAELLDDRSAIFILKFLYHARFDHELSIALGEVLGDDNPWAEIERQTIGQMELLGGDLKRMYFMDVRKGFGLPQREMSRREWERPGREFVATQYVSRIEFCGCAGFSARELLLCISPPAPRRTVGCRITLNGRRLSEVVVRHPNERYRFLLSDWPFEERLNCLEFEWDRLVGAVDLEPGDERASFVAQFGPYPIAAIMSELRLSTGALSGGIGQRWL